MKSRLKVRIYNHNKKYLLKDLIRRKIELYDISNNKEYLDITINKKDYEKISKIKTIKKIEIIDYYDINKMEYLLKKNSTFFIMFICGIIINIFLSSLIFNIVVETPNKVLEKEMLKDLEELGIKKYKIKPNYNKRQIIKEKLKNKNKDKIEWLEIVEQGTKIILKVEEKKLNKKEEICLNRNLVAKKNAVIRKINSSSGEIIKKINDYVVKGETIVSGEIHNKEEIVNTKCVEGKVLGEVWYKVKISLDKNYELEEKTNNKKYGLSLSIFNYSKDFFSNYVNYQKNEYNIINSKIIPISFNITRYEEIKKTNIKYDLNNVDDKALLLAEEELINKLPKSSKVLRKKVLKKSIKNSKIIIEVFASVEEDITDYKNIEQKEE